jgi:hypothetical protein
VKRPLEVILALLLVVAGLTSLALYQWVFVDPTQSSDWADAAGWVKERMGPNDVFRIHPSWYEAGYTHFVDVGDQTQRIRHPLLEDLYDHDTVFVVSEADRIEEALALLPFPTDDAQRQSFGTVEVARAPVPTDAFEWELLKHLDEAKVSRVRGGKTLQVCDRWDSKRRRWDCKPRNRWLYVGRALREVGDDPRECIWAHPLDSGRTLRIEATVPPSTMIRVRDSFDLRAARYPRTASVLLQVFVNDELVVEDHVGPHDYDWQPHDIDVTDFDGPVHLRMEVDLKGSVKERFFCLNAWAT